MDRKTEAPPSAFTYEQPGAPSGVPPAGPPPAYTTASTHVVVNQQPGYVLQIQYRETPVRTKCPSCSADVLTSTHYAVGTFTWVACVFLIFVGLSLFCCLIPFCMNSCKDVVHICPNCRFTIGRYNRM